MFLRLKGEASRRGLEVLVLASGRLGTSRAFLCAVAAVPALHSDSLCWQRQPRPGRSEHSTESRAPGPRGPQLCVLNNLEHTVPPGAAHVLLQPCAGTPTLCGCDLNSELKAHLPLTCPVVRPRCQ